MNAKIEGWFSEGHIIEALRGDHAFRVPDSTFRDEHNVLLVLRVLIYWAGITDNMCVAIDGFKACLGGYISSGVLSEALDLFRCYEILADGEGMNLDLDREQLAYQVAKAIRAQAAAVAANDHLRASALRFIEAHPYVREVVGLQKASGQNC